MRHSTFRCVAAVICIFLLLPPVITAPEGAYAQSAADAGTLAYVLNQLQSTLDGLMNDFRNKANELALAVGAQIQSQIDIARQELDTELGFQQLQWSTTAQTLVSNITNSINDLKNSAFAQAQDLINQFGLIVLALPFTNKTPRLRQFYPFVVPQPLPGINDLTFNIAGIFPDFGTDKKYTPVLSFAGHSYTAVSGTAYSALFHVPRTDLSFPAALQTLPATVIIQYRKSCALLFHCDSKVTIPESIALLPPSPGNLHLSFSNTTQQYRSTVKTSYLMHQDASGGDDVNHFQTAQPDPGWEVIPESVHITIRSKDGDASVDTQKGNCSTTAAACWKVTTIQHHCVMFVCPQGQDGSVSFQLSFLEQELVPHTDTGSTDLTINWGETTMYTFPTETSATGAPGVLQWVGTYTDFNNVAAPFGSGNSEINSQYMKTTNIQGTQTWVFSVYPFSVDAGSDVSALVSNPKLTDMVSILKSFGLGADFNLNPLTTFGFNRILVFGVKGLSYALPSPPAGSPSAPSGPVSISVALGDANYVVADVSPAHSGLTGPEQALQAATSSLAQATHDTSRSLK